MTLIVKTKTKQEEKVVRAFLKSLSIGFHAEAKGKTLYNAMQKRNAAKLLTAKEKKILRNLSDSVDFVRKYQKGKVKTKSLNQLLDEL